MLDNFNRANGAPGPNWVTAMDPYTIPPIVGNALSWPQYPALAWATPFDADQYASVKCPVAAGGGSLLLRWDRDPGNESGYQVAWSRNDPMQAELRRWEAGDSTLLDYANWVMDPADEYVKATIVGDVITLYGSPNGVDWTVRNVYSDDVIETGGLVGLFSSNNGPGPYGTLDDFDGGSLGDPEPPAPTLSVEAGPLGSVRATVVVPAGVTRLWLSRSGPSGEEVFVRGAVDLVVTPGTTLDIYDFEAPLGVPLIYYARGGTEAGASSSEPWTATTEVDTSPADNPWLVDLAQPLNTRRVTVESLAELAYDVPAGVHKVIGRRAPIVTSDFAQTPTFTLVFSTPDDDNREAARAALGNAMPILLRTPPEQGVGNLYLSVLGWTESRPSRLALHPDRVFTVTAVQVDRPDPRLFVPVALIETYAGVLEKYDDYFDVRASNETYEALRTTYVSRPGGSIEPWPEDDV